MKAFRNFGNLRVQIQTYGTNESPQQQEDPVHHKEAQRPSYPKPRTRSTVTIWNLPDSVIVGILRGMHIRDILSFKSAHSHFSAIVDNNISLWAHVSFADSWPTEKNIHQFIRAAEKKNVEAAVKLAVAYLYKDGLTNDDVSEASTEAAKYLCMAETLTPKTFPFFWIFIRPPWTPDGSCCKVRTFQCIKEQVDNMENPDITFGIGLILKLQRLSIQGHSAEEDQMYFSKAVTHKSAAASYFLLMDAIASHELDKAKDLERVRLLRQIAFNDILEAKLHLIKSYTQGQYGGISSHMAQSYVRDFFHSAKPSRIHTTFTGGRTSDISRYILVDWLVEVMGMKDFSGQVLYFSVSLFDRFLQARRVQRSQVQVLGVAAMVISSRFLGFDILTIREAAWLTDNSYTYQEVVRMMGEVVATLKGNLRALTIQDYMKVLLSVSKDTGYSAMLVEYIAMLCLLQSEMGQYSPAEVAASCMLLSRLLLNQEPWPATLQDWTGFTQDYLSLCTLHIYNKCLLEGSEVEYRDTKLQAVKIRYGDPNRFSVSNIEIIEPKELCRRLGVAKLVTHGKDTKTIKFRNADELILSPRRSMRPEDQHNLNQSFADEHVDRSHAATPPIKNVYGVDGSASGYEGDMEDEYDEYFSDKSDIFMELTGDLDSNISNTVDMANESKEWDGEDSVHDDCEDDTENEESILASDEDIQISKGKQIDSRKSFACLSSMCHSGTNLTCHASQSSPSSCISNCSCKRTYNSVSSSAEGSTAKMSLSSMSFLTPQNAKGSVPVSLHIPSSSSSSKQLIAQTDIPHSDDKSQHLDFAGDISSSCSNDCDTSTFAYGKCDYNLCSVGSSISCTPGEFYRLRKAKSSQELSTISSHSSHEELHACSEAFSRPFMGQIRQTGKMKNLQRKSHSVNTLYRSSAALDMQCQFIDLKQCIINSGHSSKRSQGNICNNPNSFYTPSSSHGHRQHRSGSSTICQVSILQSLMPSSLLSDHSQSEVNLLSRASTAHEECSTGVTPNCSCDNECEVSHNKPATLSLANNQERKSASCNLFAKECSVNIGSHGDEINMPSTPESATDVQQISVKMGSAIRSHPTFSCNSNHCEASPNEGYSSKRAKLDYSESFAACVEIAQKRLGLSSNAKNCDTSEYSYRSRNTSNFCDDVTQNDNHERENLARSLILRKRKGSDRNQYYE